MYQLCSDTKINILDPNLDVKMFIRGVQTYLESILSVLFVPNKKTLWLALKTLKVQVEESVFRTLQFKQPLFKVMFSKEIFPVNFYPWAENNCAFKTWQ